MARKLLIDALGAVVTVDLEGVTDAGVTAVRDAWRDALASPPPPAVAEPVEASPSPAEPVEASPALAEPVEASPPPASPPARAEPVEASPPLAEPVEASSPLAEPVEASPPLAGSPALAEPVEASSPLAEPVEASHPLAEPVEASPPLASPPALAEPVEASSPLAEPVEASPPLAEPVEASIVVPAASAQLEHMLADLSQRVTLAAIEARRGDVWMLHAAGIADDAGRVIAFVGPSGRGKTTAARALGAHFGYVSDETVAITVDGVVLPYRKPLSIIEKPGFPKVQRAPSVLGLRPLPSAPLRLSAVVLLERHADAPDEPVVESVDLGDALAELVAQTSYLPDLVDPLQTVAALVAATGGVRRVTYREAASLPSAVEQILAAPPAATLPAPAPAPAAAPAPAPRPPEPAATPTPTRRYTRTPYRDALTLADPDRVAVLHVDARGEGTVRLLAGIAPAVWRAADAASVDDLVTAAVGAYGAPPDADPRALVEDAVAELVASRALALVDDAPQRWRIRDDVAWTDSGDRVVALALSDPAASPRALQGSGTAVWRVLDGAGDAVVDDIAEQLAADFDADPALVRADVVAFLTELRDQALVEVVSGP